MARPTKMSYEQMLAFAQQYYTEQCDNNPGLLTPVRVGEFIRNQGYNIGDHLVRRNTLIKEYIEKVKNDADAAKITLVSVYKDVDIEELLRKNSTPNKLKKVLIERENYYMELTHSASVIFKENKRLIAKVKSLEKELSTLESELEDKSIVSSEAMVNYKTAMNNNRVMRDTIETYVYPEIANELLAKQGFIKETAGYLDPAKVHSGVLKADESVKTIKNNIIKGLFNSIGGVDGKKDN
jgi:hypothetical protein